MISTIVLFGFAKTLKTSEYLTSEAPQSKIGASILHPEEDTQENRHTSKPRRQANKLSSLNGYATLNPARVSLGTKCYTVLLCY